MKYEMIQLRKGVFELDFVKNEDGKNYTCATSFSRMCGFDENSVRRIIRESKILKDGTTKLKCRDTRNRLQNMIFIHSDLFLYFLSKVEGLKGAAIAPDFVQNLITMYPLFIKELQRRAQFLFEHMELNKSDQVRINKLERHRNFCNTEIKRLVRRIKQRNIEDVVYDQFTDNSVQPTLEFEDTFFRNVIEIDAEIITDND